MPVPKRGSRMVARPPVAVHELTSRERARGRRQLKPLRRFHSHKLGSEVPTDSLLVPGVEVKSAQ
jgi:hypothetical protein